MVASNTETIHAYIGIILSEFFQGGVFLVVWWQTKLNGEEKQGDFSLVITLGTAYSFNHFCDVSMSYFFIISWSLLLIDQYFVLVYGSLYMGLY